MKKLLSLVGTGILTTSGIAPLMAMTPGFINTIEENNIINIIKVTVYLKVIY
ncbi:hypothetical protein [Spiroplasma citri]|uniref:Uncharacterized protein n=1 Tax=Spiroplasma citri TaxID=2133 RepID=A0AAJ4JZB5_SPICI|nr:hypothetical protein [Spiroplasma citri]QIA69915.1 hypothetical protein GL298_10825 [Spiroplasma citri]